MFTIPRVSSFTDGGYLFPSKVAFGGVYVGLNGHQPDHELRGRIRPLRSCVRTLG